MRRCGHGREGDAVRSCPGCLLRIVPATYWEMVRFLNEARRARKRAGHGS